jgi:hypothetical protein
MGAVCSPTCRNVSGPTLARGLTAPTFSKCGPSTWRTQFVTHCVANCPGRSTQDCRRTASRIRLPLYFNRVERATRLNEQSAVGKDGRGMNGVVQLVPGDDPKLLRKRQNLNFAL